MNFTSANDTKPQRSRWLLLLSVPLLCFGLLAIVGNALLLMMRIYLETEIPWEQVPWAFRIWEIELRVVAMVVGGIFIVAASAAMHRRWILMASLMVVAIAAALINPIANDLLRHTFAGDSYLIQDGVVGVGAPPTGDLASDGLEASSATPSDDAASAAEQSPSSGDPETNVASDPSASPPPTTLEAGAPPAKPARMKLVRIPPGKFLLGRSESTANLSDRFPTIAINMPDPSFAGVIESEQPQREIRITRPFQMSDCNVTVAQFQQFVDATGYVTEPERDGIGASGYLGGEKKFGAHPDFNWRHTGFAQQPNSPVVNVTWQDAAAFCDWLSKRQQKRFRLPTSAEWEYACRAGTTTTFSCGEKMDGLLEIANVADMSYFRLVVGGPLDREGIEKVTGMAAMVNGDDGFACTSPVRIFKPNAFGLYDMHGNAATWCLDWYSTDGYRTIEADDPRGPATGELRVVRGGHWQAYPSFCRSAGKFAYRPTDRQPFLGIRVVCESE